MVIDTSAVIAILTDEPAARSCIRAMDTAESLQISTASVLEVRIVLESRFGGSATNTFDRWLENSPLEIVPLTERHVELATEGFRRFGKGRHRAALNFGVCFSYGLARFLDEPLLFIGNDFAQTDLRSAFGDPVQ